MRVTGLFWTAAFILEAQTPPQFTVTDLGILPGKAYSQATAISSNGTVVGYSGTGQLNDDTFRAYPQPGVSGQGWTYANGVLTPLPADAPTVLLGVNASGQIIGIQATGTDAFLNWPVSAFFYGTFDATNGFPNSPEQPVAISDTGVVALTNAAFAAVDLRDGPLQQAAVWSGGNPVTPLSLPNSCPALSPSKALDKNANACLTWAWGISTNGKYVAGLTLYWNMGSAEYPTLWTDGVITKFPMQGFMTSVNNAGNGVGVQIASYTNWVPSEFSAGGAATSLGTGWYPASINDSGWVVGNDNGYDANLEGAESLSLQPIGAIAAGTANAILWANNTKYNLNTCSCIGNSSGWEFDYAYAVNNAGQIVGTGFHNGVQTGFLLTPGPAEPTITAVVNGASFAKGGVVPGEMATAFGTNLTSSTGINLTSGLPLPTAFETDAVMVDNKAVALFAVDNVNGQQQINFQVPWEVANGPTATVAVSSGGTAGAAITVPVLAAQPGIFNYTSGGNTFGAILHANYQLADSAHPAKPGETVLIYCTGFGAVSSPPADGEPGKGQATIAIPTVTIGGTKAIVSFSGLAPGFVGLYQINAEVPPALTSGNHLVMVEAGAVSSNSVLLPVE